MILRRPADPPSPPRSPSAQFGPARSFLRIPTMPREIRRDPRQVRPISSTSGEYQRPGRGPGRGTGPGRGQGTGRGRLANHGAATSPICRTLGTDPRVHARAGCYALHGNSAGKRVLPCRPRHPPSIGAGHRLPAPAPSTVTLHPLRSTVYDLRSTVYGLRSIPSGPWTMDHGTWHMVCRLPSAVRHLSPWRRRDGSSSRVHLAGG
jgi:hypothetical protein